MLTPELIKPYIVHPEAAVSRAALVYFAESNLYENDPTLMPLVLEKLQQSNKEDHLSLFGVPLPAIRRNNRTDHGAFEKSASGFKHGVSSRTDPAPQRPVSA
ncbi:hypothetical protein [Paenibacillus ginsengihumi]|uniref:hypothetical protein n=1 Tax=Paenibacillus ginsengihumi TaxID=431596 RepID=UPI00146E322F|nr:hypothetical protein [Paenibacillus ginsengihumi]